MLKKLGKKLFNLPWKESYKLVHRLSKEAAKLAVPEHYTHSGSRSGHRENRGGLGKNLTTLALTLLHWTVYVVIQFVFWWALVVGLTSRFVPGLKPWFEWPFRFALRQALDFPSWAWAWGWSHLFPAIVAAVILIVLMVQAAKAEPMRMTLLAALVASAFYYGPRWANRPGPLSQASVSKIQAVSAPSNVPQIVRSSRLKTSNSSLLTANSISASSATPASTLSSLAASTPTAPPPQAGALQPTVSPVPTVQKSPDLAGQVLQQAAPDVAANAVRHLLPF